MLPVPTRPASEIASAWNEETPELDDLLLNISRSISGTPQTCMKRVRMEKYRPRPRHSPTSAMLQMMSLSEFRNASTYRDPWFLPRKKSPLRLVVLQGGKWAVGFEPKAKRRGMALSRGRTHAAGRTSAAAPGVAHASRNGENRRLPPAGDPRRAAIARPRPSPTWNTDQHEGLRRQEGKRDRAQRDRLPGARNRTQFAAGPRRQRQVPLHPVFGPRRQQVRPQPRRRRRPEGSGADAPAGDVLVQGRRRVRVHGRRGL